MERCGNAPEGELPGVAAWGMNTNPAMTTSSSKKHLSAFPPVKSGVALPPRREGLQPRRGFESRRQKTTRRNRPPVRFLKIKTRNKTQTHKNKMKINIVGPLAAEPSRSLLVGTYQGYELKTFASGFAVEQFSILVGKRVIDVGIPVPKGVDAKTLKPCTWPVGSKAIACDVNIEAGEYGLQARAKSVAMLEP
jgi:hypothetical protein